MSSEVFQQTTDSMDRAMDRVRTEFSRLRTGKATVSFLDGVKVDAYGSQMPLNQVASVSVPEPRLISIQPWDKTMITAIEKAILSGDLGLTPSNDGNVIRLNIPQLTEERRKELVRGVRKMAEEGRVAIRNARRDSNDALKASEKSGDVSEDQMHDGLQRVQDMTNDYIKKLDDLLEAKESEIMEV